MAELMHPKTARVIFRLLYILPTFLYFVPWLQARPGLTFALVFGSLVFWLMMGTLFLPRLLRIRGRDREAVLSRRAAVQGLDLAPLWLFLWPAAYMPVFHVLSFGQRLALSITAVCLFYAVLWSIDRRHHFGVF